MSQPYNYYVGDGVTTTFEFTQELNDQATVVGIVDFVNTSGTYDSVTGFFTFTTAPVLGADVYIVRSTSFDTMVATFPNQSYLTSDNLDADFRQLLNLAEEVDFYHDLYLLGSGDVPPAVSAEAAAISADEAEASAVIAASNEFNRGVFTGDIDTLTDVADIGTYTLGTGATTTGGGVTLAGFDGLTVLRTGSGQYAQILFLANNTGMYFRNTGVGGSALFNRVGLFSSSIRCNSAGTILKANDGSISVVHTAVGIYTVTHNLGNTNYVPVACAESNDAINATVTNVGLNTVVVRTREVSVAGASIDSAFTLILNQY